MQLINKLNNSWLDTIFPLITRLGEEWILIIAFPLLWYLKSKKAAKYLLLGTLISSSCSLFLKNFVFSENLRPIKYFESLNLNWHLVYGQHIHKFHSFPSGHTTFGFFIFTSLALLTKNNYLKVLCLYIAVLVGFSRCYLFQHFPDDALAGSFLGISVSVIVYLVYYGKANSNLKK